MNYEEFLNDEVHHNIELRDQRGMQVSIWHLKNGDTMMSQGISIVSHENSGGYQRVKVSCKIECFVRYSSGVAKRVVLGYNVAASGHPVQAMLYASYGDEKMTGGVLILNGIKGGSPSSIGPVTIPSRFSGDMVLNGAQISVPPRLSPTGTKYMIGMSVDEESPETFLFPRSIERRLSQSMRAAGGGTYEVFSGLYPEKDETSKKAPTRKEEPPGVDFW